MSIHRHNVQKPRRNFLKAPVRNKTYKLKNSIGDHCIAFWERHSNKTQLYDWAPTDCQENLPKCWEKKKWDSLQWAGSYPGKEAILLDA